MWLGVGKMDRFHTKVASSLVISPCALCCPNENSPIRKQHETSVVFMQDLVRALSRADPAAGLDAKYLEAMNGIAACNCERQKSLWINCRQGNKHEQ